MFSMNFHKGHFSLVSGLPGSSPLFANLTGFVTFKHLREYIIHLSLQSLIDTNQQIHQMEFFIKRASVLLVFTYLYLVKKNRNDKHQQLFLFFKMKISPGSWAQDQKVQFQLKAFTEALMPSWLHSSSITLLGNNQLYEFLQIHFLQIQTGIEENQISALLLPPMVPHSYFQQLFEISLTKACM